MKTIIPLKQKHQLTILKDIPPITFALGKDVLYFPLVEFYKLGASEAEVKNIIAKKDILYAKLDEEIIEVVTFLVAWCAFSKLSNPIFLLLGETLFDMGLETAFKNIKPGEKGTVQGIEAYRDSRGRLMFNANCLNLNSSKFELIKNDVDYWQRKLDSLEYASATSILVTPHPLVEEPRIIKGREVVNCSTAAFFVVDIIANPEKSASGGSDSKRFFKQALLHHNMEDQYNYFLYFIKTGNESICLLAQTLLADYFRDTRFKKQ